MDTAETAMLIGLGALAVGVAIGWHMRLEARKTRAAGAAPTASAGALAAAPEASNRFRMPVKGAASSSGCGCQ